MNIRVLWAESAIVFVLGCDKLYEVIFKMQRKIINFESCTKKGIKWILFNQEFINHSL